MTDPGERQVERRRHECRGAAGAEGVECGRGCPLPTGGLARGSRNSFLHFDVEMARFGGILAVYLKFYSTP